MDKSASSSNKLKLFHRFKHDTLNKEDLSLKGSIDEPIRALVEIINRNPYYYTTSTCSGRIALIEKPHRESGNKKGNQFHLSSHDLVKLEDFESVINSFVKSCTEATGGELADRCLWLKFEPFIVHIQCYDLDKARLLLNTSLASGCRNSGITLGKPDKFMLAVRSTSSMEVPIHCNSRFELSRNFVKFLWEESNARLADNLKKLAKYQQATEESLNQIRLDQ